MIEPYEYLASFGLLRSKGIARLVYAWSVPNLERFLEGYVAMSAARPFPTPASAGSLSVLPDTWSGAVDVRLIKQVAFYMDELYLHDPIPGLVREYQSIGVTVHPHLRAEAVKRLRAKLVSAIAYTVNIRALVENGFISIQPTTLADLATPPGSMFADDAFDGDGNPAADPCEGWESGGAIIDYALSNVECVALEPDTLKPLPTTAHITTSRAIGVHFRDDDASHVRYLFEVDPSSLDEETRTLNMVLSPMSQLDPEHYMNWVRTEAIKLVVRKLKTLRRDIALARFVGATLLTNVPASKDLLPLALGGEERRDSRVASLLDLELPYIEEITIEGLAKARANEIAFADFRKELSRAIRELQGIDDEAERAVRSKEIVRDLISVPVAKLKKQSQRMRVKMLAHGTESVGTLVGFLAASSAVEAVLPPNAVLAGAAILAVRSTVQGIKEYIANKDAIIDMPGYFYWQSMGRKR